jgi:hypothetical protein
VDLLQHVKISGQLIKENEKRKKDMMSHKSTNTEYLIIDLENSTLQFYSIRIERAYRGHT